MRLRIPQVFLPAIIIAGNGFSIDQINYKRLPKKFDIFRVNNFYFKKKYYLGLKVDHYLIGVELLP